MHKDQYNCSFNYQHLGNHLILYPGAMQNQMFGYVASGLTFNTCKIR